jgi:hypothetical protein
MASPSCSATHVLTSVDNLRHKQCFGSIIWQGAGETLMNRFEGSSKVLTIMFHMLKFSRSSKGLMFGNASLNESGRLVVYVMMSGIGSSSVALMKLYITHGRYWLIVR